MKESHDLFSITPVPAVRGNMQYDRSFRVLLCNFVVEYKFGVSSIDKS